MKNIINQIIPLMGWMPDTAIARRFNVESRTLNYQRTKRGITRYWDQPDVVAARQPKPRTPGDCVDCGKRLPRPKQTGRISTRCRKCFAESRANQRLNRYHNDPVARSKMLAATKRWEAKMIAMVTAG